MDFASEPIAAHRKFLQLRPRLQITLIGDGCHFKSDMRLRKMILSTVEKG